MRFKILLAAALILLGIVVFSVYSSSNNQSVPEDKRTIQKIEFNNSIFLEFSKDWNGFETVAIDTEKFRKDAKSESEANSLLEVDENDIFEEVILNDSLIKVPEQCQEFETVIVNPVKFRELALNETLNLSFMGEDYELKIYERETRKKNVTSYSGHIVRKPQSSAFFTVNNDSINGCINVDFYTLSYGIASTDEKYNGKIVHLVWKYYNEGAEEEIKKKYSLDPLEFSLTNSDKKTHKVYIELFDFYDQSMFKQTYMMNPGDMISSPKINAEPGIYRYGIILDNEFTCEQTVRADYAAELGSSEHLCIDICNDPDNPLEIGISVA